MTAPKTALPRTARIAALALLISSPAAHASAVVTALNIGVTAVCMVDSASAAQVQLKCTRDSRAPQDPRAMSGVPDALRLAGPLVLTTSSYAPDGGSLYTYVTASGEVTPAGTVSAGADPISVNPGSVNALLAAPLPAEPAADQPLLINYY